MDSLLIILLTLTLIILIVSVTKFKLKLKFSNAKADVNADEAKSKLDTLSNTEMKILKSLSEGKTNKEIASDFSISVFTVKKHVSNIFKKLGLSKRTEARQFENLIK